MIVGSLFSKRPRVTGSNCRTSCLAGVADFSAGPFLLPRDRFLLRRARGSGSPLRVGITGGSVEMGWYRFSRDRFFERNRFLERLNFDSRFFRLNFRFRCCGLVSLSNWRRCGRTARRGRRLQQNCFLFCRERADDRDAQSVSEPCIHDCAKQNLRLVANVTPEFLHEDFDLGQRHAGPASYLYEHVRCVCQHSSTIHQRIFQRLREGVMRAIVRIGFAVTKQATAIACAQSREQVIKADANESRLLDKVHNRSHALADGHIRDCEGLMNSRLRRSQIAHSIVLETDHRVGKLAEPGQRLTRLRVTPFAFESKWKGHKSDDQRAGFTGRVRNVRRRT